MFTKIIKHNVCRVKGILFISFFIPGIAFSQTDLKSFLDRIPELESRISHVMKTDSIPAFSIAVSHLDKIIWEKGYGFSDHEKKVPASATTPYPVGSVSKTMTMTAIMQLLDKGLIRLNDPAEFHMNTLKINAGKFSKDSITIERIASHTSGLARHTYLCFEDETMNCPALNDLANKYAQLVRPPGEAYEYSDLGYGILAQVVSDVSKKSYASYMKENLFEPLKMKNTFVATGFNDSRLTRSYSGTRKLMPPYYTPTMGEGGIYSSVHDLALFGILHLNQAKNAAAIISRKSVAGMQEKKVRRSEEYFYGMAWHIYENYGGYKILAHHGHNGYATAVFFIIPSENICIAAATNTSHYLPEEAAEQVMRFILPGFDTALLARQRRTWNTPSAPLASNEEYLGNWTGHVTLDTMKTPFKMWFQKDGDIHIQLGGQLRTLLNGTRMQEGLLRGSFSGTMNMPWFGNYPYNLHVKLKLREGGVLDGSITAISHSTERVRILSFPVSLSKQQ